MLGTVVLFRGPAMVGDLIGDFVSNHQRPGRAELAREIDRRVTIRAKSYVLAAGAVASSHLMLKNGIGRGLPVGKGLAFNMVAPVMAEFKEPMNSFEGIQMGHYVNDRMGGWFDKHFNNMRRAGHMAA